MENNRDSALDMLYEDRRQFFHLSEVAEYLRVGKRTVYRWVAEGDLETFKPTRKHLISKDSLRSFILRKQGLDDE